MSSHPAPSRPGIEGAIVPLTRLWPADTLRTRQFRALAVVVLGSLLLTLSAKFQIPFWPVPMTLQTAAVLAIGLVAGPRLALATVAFYLAQGALGLPVFAGTPERGLGLLYMMGPTGGYLLGFALAAAIAGLAADPRTGRLVRAAVLLAATAVIYLCGIAWLSGFIGLEAAFTAGVLPFLPAEAVKLALVFFLAEAGMNGLRRRL